MSAIIDLADVRRGRRMAQILLDRLGLPYFIFLDEEGVPRVDTDRLGAMHRMGCTWLERTGTDLPPVARQALLRVFRRIVMQRLAQTMIEAGF